ncbi:MAG: hypothetical protein HYX74_02495 [Acidobacteria bacterium]|nr:hypothetical protein [Acidobacteriota bacterium]
MKRETSMATPIFIPRRREIDWFENLPASKSLPTREERTLEWAVWTLVALSLLLALLAGTLVTHGILQFDFPLVR